MWLAGPSLRVRNAELPIGRIYRRRRYCEDVACALLHNIYVGRVSFTAGGCSRDTRDQRKKLGKQNMKKNMEEKLDWTP